MSTKLKTIIVDDEPLACDRLEGLLKHEKEIEIVAICENGEEAIKEINNQTPDLVFLDIQMPEIDGFEVLKNINQKQIPAIIFATAYDEYALKAFDVHALDYLLKPFKKERFNDALNRARNVIKYEKSTLFNKKIENLLESLNTRAPLTRIKVKSSERYFFLNVDEIDWIEAEGNYVHIYSGDKNYMIRDTMKKMVDKLDSNTFFRIHRSTIVNVDKINGLEQWFHGDYKVTLKSGKQLTLSRNYKELLKRF